jgi:DNA-binding transcriptional LysR family regulator
VQLLVRDHTGARPTESGKLLLHGARNLIAHHDELLAAVAAPTATSHGRIRVGVPLEFAVDVLPSALAQLAADYPDTKVELLHASSSAQMSALHAAELEVALVRDRPADDRFEAVLVVEESLGVILSAERSAELAEPTGVHLHELAGLQWIAFARSESPAWYDQVAATLRGHGVAVTEQSRGEGGPLIAEVKLGAARTGKAFAFAPPGWAHPLPDGMTWHPLIGNPIVRRTWAVWLAAARDRDLAALIAILDTGA